MRGRARERESCRSNLSLLPSGVVTSLASVFGKPETAIQLFEMCVVSNERGRERSVCV